MERPIDCKAGYKHHVTNEYLKHLQKSLIQRLRTEKNQAFQPVKRDTDHLQTVISTVEEAGDVMHLSQNVVETFIDRIEVFNDERVKIHFTFENVLADYAE